MKFNRRRTDDEGMQEWAKANGFDSSAKYFPVYSKSWTHWSGRGYVTMKIATHTYGWCVTVADNVNTINLGNLDYIHEVQDLYETLRAMSYENRANE